MAKEIVIDPRGKAATALGEVVASEGAGLWIIAADASIVSAWRGYVDDSDPEDDFQRALDGGTIKIGTGKGFVTLVGDCWGSKIWKTDKGIMLADVTMDEEGKAADRALALRVAQWPVAKRRRKLGSVVVKSGVMALFSPVVNGKFTPAQHAAAKKKLVKGKGGEKVLLPLPNGTYEIRQSRLGPEEFFDDDAGMYGDATWIERV